VRLVNLGHLEVDAGNLDRATQLLREALAIDQKEGDIPGVAHALEMLAAASLRAGRAREGRQLLSSSLGPVVSSGDTGLLTTALELSACIAAELGDGLSAARLAGAAEAVRRLGGMPIPEPEAALLERFLAPARATVAPQAWAGALAAGRALTQEQAVTLLVSTMPSTPPALATYAPDGGQAGAREP
jgi:hypothetical protein